MKNIVKGSTFLFLACLLSSCGICDQWFKKDEIKKETTKTAQAPRPNRPTRPTRTAQATQTAESALRYEILKAAPQDAKIPEKGKKVTVHYTGWLEENGTKGKKFDSSVDRGTPFTFTLGVGQVIKGWEEGVAKMKVGEQCRLTVPANLGYGARGAGRVIPPNANLIFDVELLETA